MSGTAALLLLQAAASSAMEARDRLEEQLAESQLAMQALQQAHDQLGRQLQQAITASAQGRPQDAARIAELSDQVQQAIASSAHGLLCSPESCCEAQRVF